MAVFKNQFEEFLEVNSGSQQPVKQAPAYHWVYITRVLTGLPPLSVGRHVQ